MNIFRVFLHLNLDSVLFKCCLVSGGSKSLFSLRSQVRTEPYKPVKTQEAIQLAKLPDAQPLDKSHVMPIERDDWPAPPAPAAACPELCMLSQ